MAKKLLTETYKFKVQLVESDEKGTLIARGQFGKADIPTANNRVYPRALWEREFKTLIPKMKKNEVYGELDHPADGQTKLQRVSHLITGVNIQDDGIIIGEAKILPDTRNGKQLMAILKNGGSVGVSSRGFGSVETNEHGQDVVQDDFQLLTWDFVADPAAGGSFPEFTYEDKKRPEIKIVNENQDDKDIEMGKKENMKTEAFVQEEQDEKTKEDEKPEEKPEEEKTENKKTEDDLKKPEDNEEEEEKKDAVEENKMEATIQKIRKEESEKLVAKLNEMIKSKEEEIRESIRSEVMSDPSIAGAKLAMEEVKKHLRPYIVSEDINEEIGAKEKQIESLQTNLKVNEEKLSEYANVTKELGYKLQVEQILNNDEFSVKEKKDIRFQVGDVMKFESLGELRNKAEFIIKKVKEGRERVAVEKTESNEKLRELESQVESLSEAYEKALGYAKQMGLRAYAENRLAGNPRGLKVKKLIENKKINSIEEVDKLIEQFEAVKTKGNDWVRKIGNKYKRQSGNSTLVEDQFKETFPKNKSTEEIVPGLTMEQIKKEL